MTAYFLTRCLAVIVVMFISWKLCRIGFSPENPTSKRRHVWFISHLGWLIRFPYVSIILLGLFLPFGGTAFGILIAQEKELPKLQATLLVFGANFVGTFGLGACIALLARSLVR